MNGDRLDSWKEFAGYLGRSVRTVQRWESERGLPVHRIPGSEAASVSALKSDLDRWLQSSGNLHEREGLSQYLPRALAEGLQMRRRWVVWIAAAG